MSVHAVSHGPILLPRRRLYVFSRWCLYLLFFSYLLFSRDARTSYIIILSVYVGMHCNQVTPVKHVLTWFIILLCCFSVVDVCYHIIIRISTAIRSPIPPTNEREKWSKQTIYIYTLCKSKNINEHEDRRKT